MDTLFKLVPAGVGSKGIVRLNSDTFKQVMVKGVDWCIENGYGWQEDRDRIEEGGHMPGANPSKVSHKATSRGISQLGTLGSGNHYLEIQVGLTDQIYDPEIAKVYGINKPDQIFVMVHCGSRGFGHQIATDYLQLFLSAMKKYGLKILDKELSCAPFNSPEGQDYFGAMVCAANSAFANRQVITHQSGRHSARCSERMPKSWECTSSMMWLTILPKLKSIISTEKKKRLLFTGKVPLALSRPTIRL